MTILQIDFLHIMHFNVKKNTICYLHQILLATQNMVPKSLSHAFPYYLHNTQIKTIWKRKYRKRLKWTSIIVKPEVLDKNGPQGVWRHHPLHIGRSSINDNATPKVFLHLAFRYWIMVINRTEATNKLMVKQLSHLLLRFFAFPSKWEVILKLNLNMQLDISIFTT